MNSDIMAAKMHDCIAIQNCGQGKYLKKTSPSTTSHFRNTLSIYIAICGNLQRMGGSKHRAQALSMMLLVPPC